MDLATLSLFLPACFALNMAPGPNNLLSVSNSTRYGYRTACLAGIGRQGGVCRQGLVGRVDQEQVHGEFQGRDRRRRDR